jgi:hypothetical protein
MQIALDIHLELTALSFTHEGGKFLTPSSPPK